MDIFKKCFDFKEAEDVQAKGIYPYFTPIDEVYGNKVKIKGKEYIMIGSNNYLGLVGDERINRAMKEAIDKYGSGTCGSRFLNGTLSMYVEFEKELAEFMEKEAALIFSTGYQTNLGIISALGTKNDALIIDRLDHASLIDATRLSFSKVYKFKHNDMDDLERILKTIPDDMGKLIVVDGVYSMDGDIAPLDRMVEIKKKYRARLFVDDAHGIGVIGEKGRGASEYYNVLKEADIVMCTFSKSFASLGGFVAGDKKVIEYIKHFGRPMIFSASITPAAAAAAKEALRIIKTEPERRKRLQEIANYMKSEFTKMGYNTGNTETAIIPVIIGDDEKTFKLWLALRELGIFVTPVISPAVSPDNSRIRTSYTATHTDEELEIVLKAFYQAGKMLNLI